ncbi:uncharacterized protein LAESUDRAFT_739028 [Laetiporus sulphureus 93-53]|uniref:Uncharacterized protein n=1 Tax=Laetiporus sulphureus 93-53 TaxID=1314785 RepID=A0A165BX93_9APHY|nr:uncharacterized protein LAESUDRAFT_739028 [Laetiporus sulphureus 93-53]KZT01818.1 hypothetical protein LAESUDRAFT_739028 [Laetiporus sulphureus 93-53]
MPVARIILEEAVVSDFRGVLLHILSNGGGLQYIKLRKALTKLPPPAMTNIAARHIPTALMAPSNPILHLLMIPPIALVYAFFYVVNSLCGHPPIFTGLRATFNSADALPSLTDPADVSSTPGLYVYSDHDKITLAPNVTVHSSEAESKEFDIAVQKFANTGHRYWGAVRRLWQRALAKSTGSSLSSTL